MKSWKSCMTAGLRGTQPRVTVWFRITCPLHFGLRKGESGTAYVYSGLQQPPRFLFPISNY